MILLVGNIIVIAQHVTWNETRGTHGEERKKGVGTRQKMLHTRPRLVLAHLPRYLVELCSVA